MDLVDILRQRISLLPEGDYTLGLKAVLLHIETAERHLRRGDSSNDDTAFTDAIYRSNQAFEGSIKEAFRVLAKQDPERKTPYEIEGYLEKEAVFRPRVLAQFTTYRKEWRNPSTHDYKLDFDESEAFLAIVSVCAFACLLLDQISENISFETVKAQADNANEHVTPDSSVKAEPLADIVIAALQRFVEGYLPTGGGASEAQVIGALHGFIASALPTLGVQIEVPLAGDRPFRADMLIVRNEERLLIELKRRLLGSNTRAGLEQVQHYLAMSGIKTGILFHIPHEPRRLVVERHAITSMDATIVVLS